jgi:hypothetical protein
MTIRVLLADDHCAASRIPDTWVSTDTIVS